jgi:hypothetical protein
MRKNAEAIASQSNTLGMPAAVQRRLFGEIPRYNETLAAAFSDLQRDALFVLPPAHMKNITVLALLGPKGPKVVANGIKYAHRLRTEPDKLAADIAELEKVGATQHYIKNTEPLYGKLPGVGPTLASIYEKSNAALERYDMGMRLALADELKSRGITGHAMGGQIRDILGDYHNQAPLVQELRARAGANFPGWGLGIVPRAMTKALREQPQAVKAYARAQNLISDDITRPMFGTDFNAGGPAEDYSALIERPDKFFKSPARSGSWGLPWGIGDAVARGQLTQFAAEQLLRLSPFGAALSNVTGFPFPSNAPAAVRGTVGLAGAYFPDAKKLAKRTAELTSLGMKGRELHDRLAAEGFFDRPDQEAPAPAPATAPATGRIDWSK